MHATWTRLRAALVAAVALLLPGAVAAQDAAPSCDGRRVTAVVVEPQPPGVISGGPWLWQAVGRVLFQHRTTRPHVAADVVRLREGDACSEAARAESERILRAQPFLADAAVRAEPDDAGGVRLVVRTVDEIPLIVGGRVSGERLTGVHFGNANVAGHGWLAAARWQQGGAFRDGLGVRLGHYHLLGGPNVAELRLERAPLGHAAEAAFAHPFYTPLQRLAWSVRYRADERYEPMLRRGAPAVSLPAERERWGAGRVARPRRRAASGASPVRSRGSARRG